MTFSRLVFCLFISALVSSCGGSDATPGPTGDPNATITVSPILLSAGATVAVAGQTVQFTGGICGGGFGKLFPSWNYGDGSANGTSNAHYYGNPGEYLVRVTCTDASNNDKKYGITTLTFIVAP